jgi:hypothetical protein
MTQKELKSQARRAPRELTGSHSLLGANSVVAFEIAARQKHQTQSTGTFFAAPGAHELNHFQGSVDKGIQLRNSLQQAISKLEGDNKNLTVCLVI